MMLSLESYCDEEQLGGESAWLRDDMIDDLAKLRIKVMLEWLVVHEMKRDGKVVTSKPFWVWPRSGGPFSFISHLLFDEFS